MSSESAPQSAPRPAPEPSATTWIVVAGLAVVSLLISAVGWWQSPADFWPGYLTAVAFWLGTSLGCLAVAMLHSLTGGAWGECIGGELRAGIGAMAVPLAAAVLLALGAAELYPAAGTDAAAELTAHQHQYFGRTTFLIRAAVFVAVWCGLSAWILWAPSRHPVNYARATSARKAALGLLAFFLTASFAVVDGIMSLTPHWFSSIFPLMHVVGFGVTGLAAAIVARSLFLPADGLSEAERGDTHDVGNMLQAFNLMWVYLAFSQYLIIWSGDLPHEVMWYADRRQPLTAGVSVALFFLHFAVPFGLLLSRPLKRQPRQLAAVAGLLLCMRLVGDAWTILPSTSASGVWAIVLLLTNAIGLGSLWLLAFLALRTQLPAIHPAAEWRAAEQHPTHGMEGPL